MTGCYYTTNCPRDKGARPRRLARGVRRSMPWCGAPLDVPGPPPPCQRRQPCSLLPPHPYKGRFLKIR
jgi:hypothetical protein